MRKYYLSQFVGDGTTREPFRPRISLYGEKWSFLDFRPDGTKREGWAITCLDTEDHSPVSQDSAILFLTDDPYGELEEEKRDYIRQELGVYFLSTSLVDICLEILLMNKVEGRGLRSGINGEYRLHLGGLLATLSEEQAIAFVGDLIDKQEAFTPTGAASSSPSSLVKSLSRSLNELRELVELGAPRWLEEATGRYPAHPLVRNYVEATIALHVGNEAVRTSSEVIWVMMLARDIQILEPHLNLTHLASRLRSEDGCEATKYELYVMAAYARQGASILVTDEGGSVEGKVTWDGNWVNLECKTKWEATIRPRDLKEVLDRANQLIRELMDEIGYKALVQITCSQDPTLAELDRVVMVVRDGLIHLGSVPVNRKDGKFTVVVIPSGAGVHQDDEGHGVVVPSEFEYAFTEGRVNAGLDGEPPVGEVWGVAWRTTNPQGWVRSVLESIRRAGQQLPADKPNIVYIQVPPGSCGVVRARIEILVPHVLHMLANHGRLNCVVLTGLCIKQTSQNQNTVMSVAYRPLFNPAARLELPARFQVLGEHFTRK